MKKSFKEIEYGVRDVLSKSDKPMTIGELIQELPFVVPQNAVSPVLNDPRGRFDTAETAHSTKLWFDALDYNKDKGRTTRPMLAL
jgi:hypothetical protein